LPQRFLDFADRIDHHLDGPGYDIPQRTSRDRYYSGCSHERPGVGHDQQLHQPLAGRRFLGLLHQPQRYRAIAEKASTIAQQVISEYFGTLAQVAKTPFKRWYSSVVVHV